MIWNLGQAQIIKPLKTLKTLMATLHFAEPPTPCRGGAALWNRRREALNRRCHKLLHLTTRYKRSLENLQEVESQLKTEHKVESQPSSSHRIYSTKTLPIDRRRESNSSRPRRNRFKRFSSLSSSRSFTPPLFLSRSGPGPGLRFWSIREKCFLLRSVLCLALLIFVELFCVVIVYVVLWFSFRFIGMKRLGVYII